MAGRLYEPHQHQQHQNNHLLDLQDNSSGSWLSGADDDLSQTLSSLSAAAAASSAAAVDPVLYNNLVEMVPLVQSLIDRKASSSYTRRGSMIHTKTPSRESLYNKTAGRSAGLPTKKNKDQNKNAANRDGCTDDISIFSSSSLLSEKDREELLTLRDQVEDLKRQLTEKDELLKSAELSKNELTSINMKFDELKNEALDKDSLIKTTKSQLSDLKVKLADKQAAVEKLQWEAMTSNKKVESLQGNLETVQGEISSFMLLIEGLTGNNFINSVGDYDVAPYLLDQSHELDFLNDMEMQKLEAAREGYITAVVAAKEKQDEESMAAAASARSRLQSIVLK